jgi:DNA-binding response OmpR family regulator
VEAARHEEQTLHAGELDVRVSDGLVLAAGRPLPLSLRELRLLVALLERRDRIVSRQELYRLAWGRALRDGDRSVDVYVHKLRHKLEEALPQQRFIHTHFGFGYRLSVEPSHAFHNTETTPEQAPETTQGETTT